MSVWQATMLEMPRRLDSSKSLVCIVSCGLSSVIGSSASAVLNEVDESMEAVKMMAVMANRRDIYLWHIELININNVARGIASSV